MFAWPPRIPFAGLASGLSRSYCLLVARVRPAVLAAFLAPALCGPGGAAAQKTEEPPSQYHIEIVRGAEPLIKLLVEDFARGGGASIDDVDPVEGVVVQDLEYSGVFSVLSIGSMGPADSASIGVGYRALVRGSVSVLGGEIVLDGTLLSLPDRQVIFERQYRTRPEWFREIAHRYADDIVLYLTGRSGIARTQITFVRVQGRSREIYLVDYDGHGLRAATANGSINMSPVWSPDSGRLAFTSYLGGDADVYQLDLASGAARPLFTGRGVQSAPAWSPAGDRIAFSTTADGQSGLFVGAAGGGDVRRLTRGIGIDTSPSWSPDGRRLVFTSDRAGSPQIYLVNADGSDTRRLTFSGGWNDQADWAPTGTRVAYASRQNGVFRIFELDVTGLGEPRQLTFGPGSDESPRWAPDGRHLVFSSGRGEGRGLYVLNADTGIVRPLVVGQGECFSPDWSSVPVR